MAEEVQSSNFQNIDEEKQALNRTVQTQSPLQGGWTNDQGESLNINVLILSNDPKKTLREKEIKVSVTDSFKEIQQIVTKETGIGEEFVFLTVNGQRINEKSNISDGTQVIVDKLILNVRFQQGEELKENFVISPFETLKDLKELIKKRTNLDGANQRLLIKNEKLQGNGKKLHELKVQDGSLIEIGFLKLQVQQLGTEQKIMIQIDPRGTGMDLGRKVAEQIKKDILTIQLFDQSNKPIACDDSSLTSMGVKNHAQIYYKLATVEASEQQKPAEDFVVTNQIEVKMKAKLDQQDLLGKNEVDAGQLKLIFQSCSKSVVFPKFEESFNYDDQAQIVFEQVAARLKCKVEEIILFTGEKERLDERKTIAALGLRSEEVLSVDRFKLRVSGEKKKEIEILINPELDTLDVLKQKLITQHNFEPTIVLKYQNGEVSSVDSQKKLQTMGISNNELISIQQPKEENQVSGERILLNEPQPPPPQVQQHQSSSTNQKNEINLPNATQQGSHAQQDQGEKNSQMNSNIGASQASKNPTPLHRAEGDDRPPLPPVTKQPVEASQPREEHRITPGHDVQIYQNTPLGTLVCFMFAAAFIILVMIPVIVLQPEEKAPEYNVKIINNICGGDSTYFTYGTLIIDRNPTYGEILSELPEGYDDEKLAHQGRKFWDSQFRVFGFTTKENLVMNKLKQNSQYKLTYYCKSGKNVSSPQSIKFKVPENGGMNLQARIATTRPNLDKGELSVAACLLADALGIERNRVFTTSGIYCYVFEEQLPEDTVINPRTVRKLSSSQYIKIAEKRTLATEQLIIDSYDFIILKNYQAYKDTSYKYITDSLTKSSVSIDAINEKLHEIFYQTPFDIFVQNLMLVSDDLNVSSAASLPDPAIEVTVDDVKPDTAQLSYSAIPEGAPEYFYRVQYDPRAIMNIKGDWPTNTGKFNIFDKSVTTTTVNLRQGRDYILFYGSKTSQLRQIQFKTCAGGCKDGVCTPEGKCSACEPGLYLNEGYCCHSLCRACRGSTQFDCLTCNQGHQQVDKDGSCQCELGYYVGGDDQCHACFPDCTRCTSPDKHSCTRCNQKENRYLRENTCLCKDGYFEVSFSLPSFLNSQEPVHCIKCEDNCGTCDQQANHCTSCKDKDFRIIDQFTSTCKCKPGYFSAGLPRCYKCTDECSECEGRNNFCLACSDPTQMAINGQCVCQYGTYAGPDGSCVPCHNSCMECLGTSSEHCTKCWPYRYSEFIRSISTSNNLQSVDLLQCHCNQDMTYPDAQVQCQPCHFSCASCSGQGKTNCISCGTNRNFFTQTDKSKLCICNPGYFPYKETCIKCHQSCDTCFGGGKNHCTSCPDNRVFQNNSCECNSQYYIQNSLGECISQL